MKSSTVVAGRLCRPYSVCRNLLQPPTSADRDAVAGNEAGGSGHRAEVEVLADVGVHLPEPGAEGQARRVKSHEEITAGTAVTGAGDFHAPRPLSSLAASS